MEILTRNIPFVKRQIEHYDRMAIKFRSTPDKQKTYVDVASELRQLVADLETASALVELAKSENTIGSDPDNSFGSKLPANFFNNPLALTPTDYAGLSDDLLSELNISPSDKLEANIIDLINAAGGVLILDKIIVGLFHITGEKHQRVTLTAKLYRMSKKKLVFSVPKKKGVYSTTAPASSETADDPEHDLLDDLT